MIAAIHKDVGGGILLVAVAVENHRYNISLEEVRGEVGGREYHGFVYSATDGQGNKVGNPSSDTEPS